MKSFDDLLEKRFPESRRKAYYLMAIQENLTRVPKQQLREIGWSKATDLAKVARREGERFESATWLHRVQVLPKEEFKRENLTGREREPWELFISNLTKANSQSSEVRSKPLGGCWVPTNLAAIVWKCSAQISWLVPVCRI